MVGAGESLLGPWRSLVARLGWAVGEMHSQLNSAHTPRHSTGALRDSMASGASKTRPMPLEASTALLVLLEVV